MKLAPKILAAIVMASLLASKPLLAGDGKSFEEKIIVEEERKIWGASLSTGWDSLYMFRGVNVLRGNEEYGSSLYWTDLNATWNITENDFINVGAWVAFGIGNTAYKELDVYTSYTHTIGNLALSFGYTFYYYMNSELYQNELSVKAAYTIELPAGTEMVMPGDNIAMEVELISPIAMEEKLRFAIREGGRTVGAGVVASIIA